MVIKDGDDHRKRESNVQATAVASPSSSNSSSEDSRLPYMVSPGAGKTPVGIDIDEVLAEFAQSFLAWYNKRHGTNHSHHQMKSYRFHENFGNERDHWVRLFDVFHDEGHVDNIPLINGATAGVRELSAFDIHAITARPLDWHGATTRWINTHFPHFKSVHSLSAYLGTGQKAKKCAELGVSVMIDDNIDYAREISKAGIPVVLLDTPWNQGPLPQSVLRAKSWSEIPTLVRKIIKE